MAVVATIAALEEQMGHIPHMLGEREDERRVELREREEERLERTDRERGIFTLSIVFVLQEQVQKVYHHSN